MNAEDVVNNLTLSIIAGAYVLLVSLLGIVWHRVEAYSTKMEAVKNELLHAISEASERFNTTISREREESIIADRRLNIHDRISSAISDEPFDSKLIAKQGQGSVPSTKRIQAIMARGAGSA